ncbi:MAG: AarF/ABC1/UbiB kinase family protein [Bdellovibrionales bacterium]|nr:AarF/ABC1/UbiB kinase family protein [Bdellovibrionales bacterium]
MSFEQLGPTWVKLGQLLASRPDLIPPSFAEEFKKLHDQVATVPFEQIEIVLSNHFGRSLDSVFASFNPSPLAAASIAQVYSAELKNGEKVVVKVQRPGIEDVIEEDLGIIYFLAELVEKYVPEASTIKPVSIVDEFFRSMDYETNFVIEANNIRRFRENFATDENVVIPKVYSQYTGKRVLVMEALQGTPLSHKEALNQEGVDSETVLRIGLRCYMKMVFRDGLFHGDLHAGNIFVLPNNKIGLIDFGVVGRLNGKSQSAIASMFIALATEDYDRLAYEYLDVAPYSDDIDADRLSRSFRDLIAPHYGMTLSDVNVGRLLLDSTSIAAKYGLGLPTELILFFKSIMTVEGMGRSIAKDFDFMAFSIEFASELVQSRYEPAKVVKGVAALGRDVNSLVTTLPRQLKQLLRRVNSPDFSVKLSVHQMEDYKKSIESSSNLIFLGLVIGSLVLSGSVIFVYGKGPLVFDQPLLSVIFFAIAGFLGFVATVNYVKK